MNSSKGWGLRVDPSIFKTLKRMPRRNAEAILEVIQLLPKNPYFGDIQKMKGENNVWRRRIGSYRIFYKIDPTLKTILIFHLERRTSKTY
jgi:mRNA-degrading endonuclease RelE of RelBE toxin-antitoxin system